MSFERPINEFCDDSAEPEADKQDEVFYASSINFKNICSLIDNDDCIFISCYEDLSAYTNDHRADDFEKPFHRALKTVRNQYPEIGYELEVCYSSSDTHCTEIYHYKITTK